MNQGWWKVWAGVLVCWSCGVAQANEVDDCFAALKTFDFGAAVSVGREAVVKYPRNSDAFYCLGQAYRETGQLQMAVPLLKRAERLTNSKEDLLFVVSQIGVAHQAAGDYAAAQTEFERALVLAKEVKNPHMEASSLSNLAVVFTKRGKFDQALVHYQEALSLKEREEDKAVTYNNLGSVYHAKGDYAQAVRNYSRAIEISEKYGDAPGLNKWRLNLADTLRKQGDFAAAEQIIRQSLLTLQRLGDRLGEAAAYRYWGWLEWDRGNREAAMAQLGKAAERYEQGGAKNNAEAVRKDMLDLKSQPAPSRSPTNP